MGLLHVITIIYYPIYRARSQSTGKSVQDRRAFTFFRRTRRQIAPWTTGGIWTPQMNVVNAQHSRHTSPRKLKVRFRLVLWAIFSGASQKWKKNKVYCKMSHKPYGFFWWFEWMLKHKMHRKSHVPSLSRNYCGIYPRCSGDPLVMWHSYGKSTCLKMENHWTHGFHSYVTHHQRVTLNISLVNFPHWQMMFPYV